MKISVLSILCVFALVISMPVLAQDLDEPNSMDSNGDLVQGVADTSTSDAPLDLDVLMSIDDAYKVRLGLGREDFSPLQMKTLFYTVWQHNLLQEAKRLFTTRKPGEYEEPVAEDPAERTRGLREISLGGILYSAKDSWIVWLNGQRVTPTAIPEEIIDISVSKEYIELKWLDSYNNLIFPIRLRPHQRFNLDTRIFLPGRSVQ